MKKVTLKSLSLNNFRGEKERTTVFNLNGETTIAGENGLGKSRHFDAFMWLLFGKDTKDRKDYNVRTVENGEPIHRVECSVSAELEIDGAPLQLKRAFIERWVKPRGQTEEVFKGNETETFWNGTPVLVTDYTKRINEIINDSVFKMVTNPFYFPSLGWQVQREQLFQLAGTITDIEIAAQKPEFAALLDRISGKSFADFKRETAARKKLLKEELEQIQPRIDQTQHLMPEDADFAKMEADKAELDVLLNKIDSALLDKTEEIRQEYEAVQTKQAEINTLKTKKQDIAFKLQTAAKDSEYKAGAQRRETESEIKATEREIDSITRDIKNREIELTRLQSSIASKEDQVVKLRDAWCKENEVEYSGDDMCHTCGQLLPEAMRDNARQMFSDAKTKKLADMNKDGAALNADIASLKKDASELENGINTSKDEVLEKEATLANFRTKLESLSVITVNADLSGSKEYNEVEQSILSLEAELSKMPTGNAADTSALRERKTGILEDIKALENKLHDRELIAKYKHEIEELEAKGKRIAQQIADVEREEYTMAQFSKAKIDECERRINSLFHHVTFRLFDYTIDGSESETCVPLVNGVPFDVANTAGQVNAGLDIINTLVRFHGVSAPIFIDGRESVNRIIPTESQIINLVVTLDKTLIIK